MKNMLIATLLIALSGKALAFDPTPLTVKVRSGLCHSNDVDWRGSGVLLSHGGKVYVLTSEHVLFHGNGDFCHRVSSDSLGVRNAILVAADWGTGLALLALPSVVPNDFMLTLAALNTATVTQGTPTVLSGYPWALEMNVVDGGGRVLVPESPRHFLAASPSAIEVTAGHGEFGMSGGGAFSEGGEFVGILSHQFLSIVAGGKTTVGEYREGMTEIQNDLLLIPAVRVAAWLSTLLNSPERFAASFVRSPERQLEGMHSIFSEGIEFRAIETAEACQDAAVSGSVGGGDPIGIGGGGESDKAVRIEVLRDHSQSDHIVPTQWYLPAKAAWLDAVRTRLVTPAQVEITGLAWRNPETSELSRVCFRSLEEFFRKLTSPSASAIAVIQSTSGSSDLESIRNQAQEMSRIATLLGQGMLSARTRLFLHHVETVSSLLQSESWSIVEPADVATLVDIRGVHKIAWQEIFSESFDLGSDLLGRLQQALEELKKIRV